jgi:hypothetical protein
MTRQIRWRFNHLRSCSVMLAAAMLVLIGAASASAAGDAAADRDRAKNEEFVNRLFAGPLTKNKTYACFIRQYDAEHLARHPLQKVSAMELLVTAETVPESDGPSYSFRLGVRYRDKSGAFDSSGDCHHSEISADTDNEARLDCGVDCDGGRISIGLTKDYKATLIRLERIRIWRNNKPEDEASLVAGADDKIFRLDRAGLEECIGAIYLYPRWRASGHGSRPGASRQRPRRRRIAPRSSITSATATRSISCSAIFRTISKAWAVRTR